MRNSKQRNLILKTLTENMVHPSCEYIYELVKKQMPSISLATVYRNLKQLSDEGIITKVEGIDGSMHFDHNTHKHHHFVCNICKTIYDVDCDLVPSPDTKSFLEMGLNLTQCDVNLKGVCHKCQNI